MAKTEDRQCLLWLLGYLETTKSEETIVYKKVREHLKKMQDQEKLVRDLAG